MIWLIIGLIIIVVYLIGEVITYSVTLRGDTNQDDKNWASVFGAVWPAYLALVFWGKLREIYNDFFGSSKR